jgi:hypothetical protein
MFVLFLLWRSTDRVHRIHLAYQMAYQSTTIVLLLCLMVGAVSRLEMVGGLFKASPRSQNPTEVNMYPPMTDDWRHGPRLLVSRRFGVIDLIRVIGSLAQSFSSWKVYCFCVRLISQQYRKSNLWNEVFQHDHNNIPTMSKPYNGNTALKVTTNLIYVAFLGLHSWYWTAVVGSEWRSQRSLCLKMGRGPRTGTAKWYLLWCKCINVIILDICLILIYILYIYLYY